ncbi:hypothetical protein B0H10DRAFT_2216488 [Mycena sp. CBHHK59/15]|nr:hypothetical protein B0H10DRAFT_2216488 [Mycena sp. CBHHK59/15]
MARADPYPAPYGQPPYPRDAPYPPRGAGMYMAPPRASSSGGPTPLYPSPVPAPPPQAPSPTATAYSEPSSMYHGPPRSPAMNSSRRCGRTPTGSAAAAMTIVIVTVTGRDREQRERDREDVLRRPARDFPPLPPHSSHPSLERAPPPAPGPPPPTGPVWASQQRTFQNQFHTQFVPVRDTSPPRDPKAKRPQEKRPTASWTDKDWADDARVDWESQRPPPPAAPERPFRARRTVELGTFDGQLADEPGTPSHLTHASRSSSPPRTSLRPDPRARVSGAAASAPPCRRAPAAVSSPDTRRRIYTDDSDPLAAAVHAGRLSWPAIFRARMQRRDVRLELRLLRSLGDGGAGEAVGRFAGGWGAAYVDAEDGDAADDGRGLLSAAWGAGHEGSAFEPNTAHGLTRANRAQRLAEYGARRAVVLDAPTRGRKRRWEDAWSSPRRLPNASVLHAIAEAEDEDAGEEEKPGSEDVQCEVESAMMRARTMVFGFGGVGFKYDATALRGVLFPPDDNADGPRPRKRRRLSGGMAVDAPDEAVEPSADRAEEQKTEDDNTAAGDAEDEPRALILDADDATYLLRGVRGRWDVGVVGGTGGGSGEAQTAVSPRTKIADGATPTPLHSALGLDAVDCAAEGVRFRGADGEWGAWVRVGMWRWTRDAL